MSTPNPTAPDKGYLPLLEEYAQALVDDMLASTPGAGDLYVAAPKTWARMRAKFAVAPRKGIIGGYTVTRESPVVRGEGEGTRLLEAKHLRTDGTCEPPDHNHRFYVDPDFPRPPPDHEGSTWHMRSQYALEAGDILVKRNGEVFLYDPAWGPAYLAQDLFRVRPDTAKVMPAYLALALQGSAGLPLAIAQSMEQVVSIEMLENLPLCLPPLDEQLQRLEKFKTALEAVHKKQQVVSGQRPRMRP